MIQVLVLVLRIVMVLKVGLRIMMSVVLVLQNQIQPVYLIVLVYGVGLLK